MSNYSREKMIKKLIDAALYCLNVEKAEDLENIEKFLTYFFAIKGPDFFQTFDSDEKIKEYSATLCDLWHHFQDITPAHAPRIYFFENSFCNQQTFVSIVNLDQPFLVATVKIILKDLGLQPALLMHPVLTTLRDKTGKLSKIVKTKTSPKDENSEMFEESVIHFMLPLSEKELEATGLAQRIIEAFSDISIVAKDSSKVIENLHKLSASYTKVSAEHPLKTPNREHYQGVAKFLGWLNDEYFIPCGYRYFPQKNQDTLLIDPKTSSNRLGILTDDKHNLSDDFLPNLNKIHDKQQDRLMHLTFDKLNVRSRFNRGSLFDSLNVLDLNDYGHVVGIHQYIGLFTAKFFESPPLSVPIINKRVQNLFDRFGFKHDWYNGKLLSFIIESIPLDVLFIQSQDDIFHLCEDVLRLQNNVCVFYRSLDSAENIIFLIYISKEKYSYEIKEAFKDHIEKQFNSPIRSEHIYLRESTFARIVFSLDLKVSETNVPTEKHLANELTTLSETWFERLLTITDAPTATAIEALFPKKFKQDFYPKDALPIYMDYKALLDEQADVRFGLVKTDGQIRLNIIKSGAPIMLAQILSVIEKFGLQIISESTFKLDTEQQISLHVFFLQFDNSEQNFDKIAPNLIEGLNYVWHGNSENDYLNTLIQLKGLNIREVTILRAYIRALLQMGIRYSSDYMAQCLQHHPKVVGYFIELFHARFHPENVDLEKAKSVIQKINKYIKTLEKLDDDRIIRRLLNAILSTLRTNYYQVDQKTKAPKNYLSFKFDSHQLDDLPNPRPMFEIFVYSHVMEGCHLRGGKVARGGIRWSDRLEDYRSEVLALMKAQMVKNSVIVPLGSKGGFIARHYEQMRQHGAKSAELKEYVVSCYETLMRGLLDLTDNRVGERIVTPLNCVCYDDVDPYLVVAADKGTATFSDIANGISEEYNFWLGDAFASGGSKGYDHKKMAITARGAWVSIAQHFNEIGIDIYENPFTVVGVGDMAGDVFGNGMLQTPQAKLIAAFNHEHIFIDPNPDAEASFKERKRLFNLPGSKWSDYKLENISEGGGVFNRSEKSIKLTAAINAVLDIDEKISEITPDGLISHILKAQVDLLWFGGIGTFVKAKTEGHEDVKDHVNDVVRINGGDIRAHIVGEGANLGMTQLGRVEYALKGGRINTDAIDNSAGVDCSDHEVNIKILFRQLEQAGHITRDNRDKLLKTMTHDVAELVLNDNREQNFILSVMQRRASQDLFSYQGLMKTLSTAKALPLNRIVEFLPDDDELQKRHSQHQGLTRPELSVILAYTKINLYTQILPIIDSVEGDSFLLNYFPEVLQNDYKDAILNHGLKNEIKATVIVNYLINRLGALFFYEMGLSTSHNMTHILAAVLKIIAIFDLDKIWSVIKEHNDVPDQQYTMLHNLISLMRQMVMVVLRSKKALSINEFKKKAAPLIEAYATALKIKTSSSHYHLKNALQIAKYFPVILEYICHDGKVLGSPNDFVNLYQKFVTSLQLDVFESVKKNVMPQTDWERMVKNTLSDDLSQAEWELLKIHLANHATAGFVINEDDYEQKLSPLKVALATESVMTLGHLTYCVKLLHQLAETTAE